MQKTFGAFAAGAASVAYAAGSVDAGGACTLPTWFDGLKEGGALLLLALLIYLIVQNMVPAFIGALTAQREGFRDALAELRASIDKNTEAVHELEKGKD